MSDITANIVVGMPSQLFTLARSFKANANGQIYIGQIDTDPTIPANQITVYLENEDGSHVPVSQPISINSGGFPVYSGQIAKFVTVQGYSMAVYDAYGTQQFYFPNILKYDPDQLEQRLASASPGMGDAMITVKSPLAGAVARSQHDKNTDYVTPEDFGAIGDGTNHPLSERFSTLTAAQVVYPFVTSLTQSIDWAACQASLNTGVLNIGRKTYSCSNTLNRTGAVSIIGFGEGISKLLFTGSGNGINIVLEDNKDSKFYLDGFSVLTTAMPSSTSKNTGIKIDGSAQVTPPVDSHSLGILKHRSEGRGTIQNLRCAGNDVESSGWFRGYWLNSVMNFHMRNFTYCGYVDPTLDVFTGDAIVISGDGDVTDFSISRFWVFFCDTAIRFPDYVEGPHIYDFEMMGLNNGIVGGVRTPETVVPDITGRINSPGVLSAWIHNGHINSRKECIIFPSNCYLPKLEDLHVFCAPRATDTQGRSAISLSFLGGPFINNLYALLDGAQNTAYLDDNCAVFFGGVAGGSVNGLKVGGITNRGTAIMFGNNTNGCSFDNISTNTKYGFRELGTVQSPNNTFGKVLPGFGTARFSWTVSRDISSINYAVINASALVTLSGSGGAAENFVDFTPPSVLSEVPANVSVNMAYSSNVTAAAYYDFDNSTTTRIRVKVRSQSVTGNISIRVSCVYPLT
jgi:hypothetical protein